MSRAVVLLSGGIDSSTALAVAKSEGYELYALTFDYNQRHKRELESAGLVASTLGAQKHLIIRFDLREIGGSALTSEIEVPKVRIQDTVPPPIPPPRGGRVREGVKVWVLLFLLPMSLRVTLYFYPLLLHGQRFSGQRIFL